MTAADGSAQSEEVCYETRGSTSPERKDADQWKNVWALEVPGGYKHFVWSALNNALPTRSNLLKKKVCEDPWCPSCKREEEDVQHALWCCPGAADVWAVGWSPIRKWLNQFIDFSSLWEDLSNRLSPGCLVRVVAIIRGIWRRRNTFVFEDKFASSSQVVKIAVVGLEEFQEANVKVTRRLSKGVERREGRGWQKPLRALCKLNFDATVDVKNRRIGIGIIIRDCHGDVLVAVCLRKDNLVSPFIAECFALKISIELCLEMGFGSIMMEGDAKVMIEAMLSKELDESVHGQLIEDTKRLLAQ
ncbi:uncharacterized protein LOC121265715 [Juglans microcarpa x Juglans regia]|uniref:uncharacterized protein LOC121265715 n=1 Tax=Juglans microcarpa x Juglans regia TaxID=2249226 RepID=UPI001B7DB892|nr:uncharacterized protein LOC121265715 [Juglans microcarpa x Juglans regia]